MKINQSICSIFFAVCSMNALAQSSLPKDVAAQVNGKAISQALFDQNIKANLAQGMKDTPELRKVLLDELINRELLAQDASKKGLDATPEVKMQLEQLRHNAVAELALSDFFKKNPINESQLKAEYDAQVKALGDVSAMQQYKLSQILLLDEATAKTAMARLKKESFDKVAKELSKDQSGARGGDLGWVLPNQIIPALANVMVNLNKGAVSATPIQTQNGWHIIKLEDKRAFKIPSFEESKERLQMSLVQKMRNDYLAQLRKDAKINP